MNRFKQFCLLLCCSLVCLNGFLPVVSYAADNELIGNLIKVSYTADGNDLYATESITYDNETGYYTIPSQSFDKVYTIVLELSKSEFVPLYNAYDYYLILTAYSDVDVHNFTFAAQGGALSMANCDGYEYDFLEDYQYYHHDGIGYTGFTMVGKITDLNSTSISFIDIHDYNYGSVPDGTMNFKYQIVSVEKSSNTDFSALVAERLESIDTKLQQNNQLVQDAIDKIEDQYSVSDEENFGVEDIVNQVNQKAGVLSFGTDTLVNFLDLFDAANATNTKLTFPGFSMDIQGVNYQVWPDYEYDLSELENQFGALLEVVRWGCVMVVWLAVLNYLVKAYDTIFGR